MKIFVPNTPWLIEGLYGVYLVKERMGDVVHYMAKDIIDLYSWLERRLTAQDMDALVESMTAYLIEIDAGLN